VIALAFLAKVALWVAGVVIGTVLGFLVLVYMGIASTDEARGRKRR
jgi:hypothetical protein